MNLVSKDSGDEGYPKDIGVFEIVKPDTTPGTSPLMASGFGRYILARKQRLKSGLAQSSTYIQEPGLDPSCCDGSEGNPGAEMPDQNGSAYLAVHGAPDLSSRTQA